MSLLNTTFCHTTVKTYAGPEVVIARGAAVEGCLDVVRALYYIYIRDIHILEVIEVIII